MPATTRVLYSGVFFSLALSITACVPPWYPVGEGECSAESCGETDTTGDVGDPPLTTTSTVTGNTSSTSGDGSTSASASSDTGEAMSTGDADGPPVISKHELEPATIKDAGAITARIWIDGRPGLADGVRMDLADGTEVLLTLNQETQAFEGEILALSGFQNSDYVATFTPWRGAVEGEAIEVPYTVALHEPGAEDLFDVDKDAGFGATAAIAALSNGDVVELLTLGQGTSGCFLRRRSAEGEILGELVPLLADHCKAIDLEVHEDALFALMEAETMQGAQWWVAKVPYWGAYHTVVTTGGSGEVAYDLAVSSDGTVAVCGSAPTIQPDDLADAAVHVVRPDFSKFVRTFDHTRNGEGHVMDERALGCAFDPSDDDRLIMVGEVFGKQGDNDVVKRKRRFDVVFDLKTNEGDLRVAGVGLGTTQSVAVDVIVDDQGRSFWVGYECDDACVKIEGLLGAIDADGDLAPAMSLGVHSNKALTPSKLRVSPAGYLVVTSGGLEGSEPAFTVRAYAPFKTEPLWTYAHQDAGLIHLAHALAIGPYGEIYAGGFGANGYPVFVILYG